MSSTTADNENDNEDTNGYTNRDGYDEIEDVDLSDDDGDGFPAKDDDTRARDDNVVATEPKLEMSTVTATEENKKYEEIIDDVPKSDENDSKVKESNNYTTSEDESDKDEINNQELNELKTKFSNLESENTRLKNEIDKLRQAYEQSQQREALSTSRLNESKKKEALSSQLAQKYKIEINDLKENDDTTRKQLDQEVKSKEKLESTLEKIKIKTIEKIRSLEEELVQERNWNEERKQKMKMFVQTKANELSSMSEEKQRLEKELQQTRLSLRSVRCDYDATLTKLKERDDTIESLTQTVESLQKNTSQLQSTSLEVQKTLELSEKETEEHKVKRLTAKHELMTILRKLEAEQAVGNQLREVLKSTFVPKALSQQQLLSEGNTLLLECIDKMNFPTYITSTTPISQTTSTNTPPDPNYLPSKSTQVQLDINTKRLLTNLETESQKVSQNIMLLLSTVEQLQHLITERDKQKGCVESLSFWLGSNHAHHDTTAAIEPNLEESDVGTRTRISKGERKWKPNRDNHRYGYIPNS